MNALKLVVIAVVIAVVLVFCGSGRIIIYIVKINVLLIRRLRGGIVRGISRINGSFITASLSPEMHVIPDCAETAREISLGTITLDDMVSSI